MLNLIQHPRFTDALQKIVRTIEAAQDGSSVSCIVLDGPSGAGKSILLEHLASMYPPHRDASGRKVPILRIAMPSNPTIKGVASLIIEGVGDGVPIRGTETAVTQRAKRQLRNVENQGFVLDDTQHLVDHCTVRDQKRFTDWLKDIVEDTRGALILAGLPRTHQLLALNDQLWRRFNDSAHLPRLAWTDESDRNLFLDILAHIQNHLEDFEMPQLDSDELGFRLYAATGGLIGYVVKMLEEAVRIARRQDTHVISLQTLAAAHRFIVYRKPPGLEHPLDLQLDLAPDAETLGHIQTMGVDDTLVRQAR